MGALDRPAVSMSWMMTPQELLTNQNSLDRFCRRGNWFLDLLVTLVKSSVVPEHSQLDQKDQ